MATRNEVMRYLNQLMELGETNLVMPEGMPKIAGDRGAGEVGGGRKGSGPAIAGAGAQKAEGSRGKNREASPASPPPPAPPPGITIERPAVNLFEDDPLREYDLKQLANVIGACTKCGLCESRTNAVPGEGPRDADLMVVGEGPGATEDETGRPFVGRAGLLLNDILAAIDYPRETVYIANIVKCRPPANRNPERQEIEQCLPYLHRQIALIQPKVILAMGSTAAATLLNARGSLGSMRNRIHRFWGIPLIVTYHPAALLRNPHWKKPTWDDVRIARRILADGH